MPWRELTVRLDAAELPRAEALLRLAGADAISLASGDDSVLLEPAPGAEPLWRHLSLRALFGESADLALVERLLREALGRDAQVQVAALPDERWTGAAPFTVQRIGRRLQIVPADQDVPEGPAATVALHMGLAFGTGEHPTTRLCLEWLEAHLRRGARVLDYGAGTGVLALAALALGASRAWAVDIDPQALTATAENARLNDRGKALWYGTPPAFDALPAARGTMDVVVANLLAGPLQDLARPLRGYLADGGHVVLSGVLASQCEAVEASFRPSFEQFRREIREDWARIDARAA